MRDEINDALESARTVGLSGNAAARPLRARSRENVRAILLHFIASLPEDMTAAEIREELE